MKFEFVEFYPCHFEKFKKIIGTVHIYIADFELDIRGIYVSISGKCMYFTIPYRTVIDHETREIIKFPILGWTNQKNQKEMIDFLQNKVKPIILERLKLKKENETSLKEKKE